MRTMMCVKTENDDRHICAVDCDGDVIVPREGEKVMYKGIAYRVRSVSYEYSDRNEYVIPSVSITVECSQVW